MRRRSAFPWRRMRIIRLMTGLTVVACATAAPGTSVPARALLLADRAGLATNSGMPRVGGAWTELSSGTYNADAPGYRDPAFSSYGSGYGLVSGRITALATDGGWVYAGAADGGVWVSHDSGRHWRPTFQHQSTAAVGALWVNPVDHSLWVGTGEANTNFDGYPGEGVFRSANRGESYARVGGGELSGASIYHLRSGDGYLFAATSHGLWRRPLSARPRTPWQLVLKPDPNPDHSPYRTSMVTDVAVNPGTGSVLAAIGWRLGTPYNGFYLSVRKGAPASFARIRPQGLDSDIGRTTFGYAPGGRALYAVIQSPDYLDNGPPKPAESTVLKGVFAARDGNPLGPWTKIADTKTLAGSGSAMQYPSGYEPGVQAWYNQAILIDPAKPDRIFLGLEEIYESADAGKTWHAIGPYSNKIPACYVPPGPDKCPFTTHPDQHAFAINRNGTLYTASDGGVWSRPAALGPVVRWTDDNATLHTLQYYQALPGRAPGGGYAEWGGLQDNGLSRNPAHGQAMVQASVGNGGDGGSVLVDPANADNVATGLLMDIVISNDGGRSDGRTSAWRTASPACFYNPGLGGCDPAPAILAPIAADASDGNDWITGGRYIWETSRGFATTCTPAACDWKRVYDVGANRSVTAVAEDRGIAYAGWCSPEEACNPSGPGSTGFASGLATNYGGTWHAITASGLPARYVSAIVISPSHPGLVYAVFGGYSRQWIPSGGTGHVFVSADGGGHWTDISGNLPDAPVNGMVLWRGHLVVAGTAGVFTAAIPHGDAVPAWSRLGTGLPSAVADSVAVYPGNAALLLATHGRGLWRLGAPAGH